MKYIFSLVFFWGSLPLLSQSTGYLGQRIKFDVSFNPSVYVGITNYALGGYIDSDPVKVPKGNGMLVGNGFLGIKGINVFSGFKIGVDYINSRNTTLGFDFRNSMFYGVINDRTVQKKFRHFRINYNSYQFIYSKYYSLAPLQKYFSFGLGLNRLNPELDEPDIVEYLSVLEGMDRNKIFVHLGYGLNHYLTNNIFLNAGLDWNIGLNLFSRTKYEFEEDGYYRVNFELFTAEIFRLNFGVGASF